MSDSVKLRRAVSPARPERAGRAVLLRACNASGLTQLELGRLIGTDDRGVRRLLRRGRARADRLDLLVAIEGLGKERRSDEASGRKTRTLPPSVEPKTICRSVKVAHGGLLASEQELATVEPLRALKPAAQSSGNRVHAEASSGGESAAAAAVAQPGSAPLPELPVAEVTRSNRVGGPRSGSLSSERGPFQNACATIDVPGRSPVALPPRSGAEGQRQPAIDETSGESRVVASSGRCPPRLILNQVEERTACAASDSRERPAPLRSAAADQAPGDNRSVTCVAVPGLDKQGLAGQRASSKPTGAHREDGPGPRAAGESNGLPKSAHAQTGSEARSKDLLGRAANFSKRRAA